MIKKNLMKNNKNSSRKGLKAASVVAMLLLTTALATACSKDDAQEAANDVQTMETQTSETAAETATETQATENVTETSTEAESTEAVTESESIESSETETEVSFLDAGNGLKVSNLGNYTGMYMEDGTDEVVSDVMMVEVTNESENTLQYAKITLSGEAGDAVFELTTLNPGESLVVLEANRKAYSEADSYTSAASENVVFFTEPLNLYAEKLEIQALDGAFNITNISDEDITGDICVYYKNSSNGVIYGGITYRAWVEGGLKAGELKQVMTNHFTDNSTTVVFITIQE